MPQSLAPPPASLGARRVVAPSVERIRASLRFDVAAEEASGTASIDFCGGTVDGRPALDLRQEVEWVRLDGRDLSPDDYARQDLGAGPEAGMRVLDVEIESESRHRLQVGYRLG
ncbi:MAG TPA: hypothetical protein VFH70_10425, partial [Acidimicrobiales bacterium]|nr:hypothetical protein [Acidimicrobiales bacterium]